MRPEGSRAGVAGAPPWRLLIADEQALFREAMVAAFDAEDDFEFVGEAEHAFRLLDDAARAEPDVVLLGTTLPPGDWRVTCGALVDSSRAPRVVVKERRRDQDTLLAAMEAGADGYVSGELDLGEVVSAVRQVLRGHTFVPPAMLGPLLAALLTRRRADDRVLHSFLSLTRREREVLELLVDGLGPDAVAISLTISPQTARTHIQNIIQKLDVHSRLEVVALAVTHGVMERLPQRVLQTP